MTTPSLPPGFVLDQPSRLTTERDSVGMPNLPPGFVLDHGGAPEPLMDYDRPNDAVRGDILKLKGQDRERATREWADRYVQRERDGAGAGIAVDNTVRTLTRGTFVGPFLDELTAITRDPVAALNAAVVGRDSDAALPYYEGLEYQRARDRAVDRDYPVLSTAGQLVGGVASGIGGLRSAAQAPVASAVVGGPVPFMRPHATTAGRLGQAAATGALYGAAAGFGNGEGGVGGRAESAAGGVALGGLAGGVLGGLAEGAGRVMGHAAGSRAAANAETATPQQGALTATARALERDRISADDLIGQIRSELPAPTARARVRLTPEQSEELVRRHIAGESADDIGQALGISANVARGYIGQIPARSRGPLNLVDRASLVRTGAGENTQMTMRAAAATPGEARGIAREVLLERQLGANARLGQAFDRIVGSGDYDGVAARHADRLRQASDQAYAAARQAEQPFDLEPIVRGYQRQFGSGRGPVPEAVNKALDSVLSRIPIRNDMTGMVVGQQLRPPRTIDEFISARQNIAAAIEAARGEPSVQRALIQLRDDLSNEVRRTNPAWGAANDLYRDGRAAQDALEAGSRMATRLNARTREGLQEFTDARAAYNAASRARDQAGMEAAESRMELFRVGLTRSLNDQLANSNATGDLTRTLRLPAARQIISTVLGDEQAAQLLRIIDAEHAMLRTHQSQFGSQTTPLREAIDDLNWAPRMRSWLDMANPVNAMAAAGEAVSSRLNASRNAAMMPMMTSTDPIMQLAMLRAMQGVQTARHGARVNAGRAGVATSALAGMQAGNAMRDAREGR